MADVLASRLSYCKRRFGPLQGVRAAETLNIPHRPNGRLAFCSLFAGWWCRCPWRHSVNREFPDLLQHSLHCARSTSKVCIAPMGDPSFARCLQGGGVMVWGGTVSIVNSQIYSNTATYVRARLQKFPSPRWENALLTCPFRFSSFMMGAASIYQNGVRAICA